MGMTTLWFICILYLCIMTLQTEQFSCVTYNSQGLGPGRIQFISELVKKHDFVFLQEHWLFESAISDFENSLRIATVHGVSGMIESELLGGRPYGGVAIVWKKDLKHTVTCLKVKSKRVCAVIMKLNGIKILLCSVYMPQSDKHDEYQETLLTLSDICSSSDIDRIIIGGDMNVDTSRVGDRNLGSFQAFANRESLKLGVQYKEVDYTYESKINGSRSTLDYFLVSDNLFNQIVDYKVSHAVDNFSDHSNLVIIFHVPIEYVEDNPNRPKPSGVMWKRATNDDVINYKLRLDEILEGINYSCDATTCRDFFCKGHRDAIEALHDHLTDACIQAGEMCIPDHNDLSMKGKTQIRGWNDIIRDFRDRAMFWHNMWKDMGSPRQGVVADIRRSTRARYHLAIRQLKAANKLAESNELAETFLEPSSQSFWEKVKKIKGRKSEPPNIMDDKTDRESIANLFANKYECLYSSVSYDVNEMNELLNDIENRIGQIRCHIKCNDQAHVVTPADVERAIKKLNRGKHEGKYELYSDHLINGTAKLNEGLAGLFTAMLIHAYIPQGFRESVVFPIPKNKRKSLKDSDNYRGITLSSILGKVLDNILLNKFNDVLSSSDLQFGFKPKSSTTQCTFVLNETIQYYRSRGSGVFTMLLDASKAFDRVHYIKLFRLLLRKGCCPVIARFLAILYTDQQVSVTWNGTPSRTFEVNNGIKQGGVLSPVLFCVYMDELLLRLKQSGYGCHIGTMFMGAFGYADDVVILSPTRYGLRKMLSICSSYSKEYHVEFNPEKCKLLYFGDDNLQINTVNWEGQVIKVIDKAVHLGYTVGNNADVEVIENAVNELYARTNLLMSVFGHCYAHIRYKIFKTSAMALYGSVLWDMSGRSIVKFLTAWRKCVRKVYDIPYRTHCKLLPLICGDLSPDLQIQARFVKFLKSATTSVNSTVQLCGKIVMNGSRSNVSKNISLICNNAHVSREDILSLKMTNVPVTAGEQLTANAGMIQDLIYARDAKDFSFFSYAEIRMLIEIICVD